MSESISTDRRLFKEVSTILIVKILLLLGLWYAFFSSPADPDLDSKRVATHISGPVRH